MTWIKPQTEEQWMECLSAYLDHEMDPEERAAIETWLQTCPERQRQLDTLRKTSSILQGWAVQAPEPSPAFIHRLVKAEESARQSFWQRWFGESRSWFPFASGVATGMCVLFLLQIGLQAEINSFSEPGVHRISSSPVINITITPNQAESLMDEVTATSLTTQLKTQLRKYQWRDASFTYQTLIQNYSETQAFQDIQKSTSLRPILNKINSARSI